MGIFQQLWLQVYENVVMSTFPNFHDGFFDGLWTSENKSVHLFLRTSNGERSTIVLNEVERLNTSNFMAGNIILDVLLVEPEKLTIAHIEPALSASTYTGRTRPTTSREGTATWAFGARNQSVIRG